ncbi:MAG: permease-like cell division protein FtsX [bacterium]
MPLASWSFFFAECLLNIRRHGSATAITLLQCISSLTVLGICLVVIINANHLTMNFLASLEVVAFLHPDVTAAEANQMQVQLTSQPGVQAVTYVSKEDAYQKAQELLSFPVDEMLGEGNPFPASLEIRVTHAGALEPVQQLCESFGGVERVMGPGRYESVLPVMFFMQAACFFLTLIFAGTTLFTIKNTIQLAVMSRRTEIKVMQLVGATPLFVRVPFVLEGLLYGLVGAIVAWVVVSGSYGMLYAYLVNQNPLAVLARPGAIAINTGIVLVVVGSLVGFLGALVSVDRHLVEKRQHSSAPVLGVA